MLTPKNHEYNPHNADLNTHFLNPIIHYLHSKVLFKNKIIIEKPYFKIIYLIQRRQD